MLRILNQCLRHKSTYSSNRRKDLLLEIKVKEQFLLSNWKNILSICYQIYLLFNPFVIWSILLSAPFVINSICYPSYLLSNPFVIRSIRYLIHFFPIHLLSYPFVIRSIRYPIHSLSDPFVIRSIRYPINSSSLCSSKFLI